MLLRYLMKLIIAGSRTLNPDMETIHNAITKRNLSITQVVSGKATGVDTAGEAYAKHYGISVQCFPADWDDLSVKGAVIKTNSFGKKYNAVAGHNRNRKMAEYADALLLIWDGKSTGSANMKAEMLKTGKPVFEVIIKSKRQRKFDPNKDGIDHINVYSQGKTPIGRFLSNFEYSPIITVDGNFDSIEGYWYWLKTQGHPSRDKLRTVSGARAKEVGRYMCGADSLLVSEDFKKKILAAIKIKLEAYPKWRESLSKLDKPLTHYYVYGPKVINVPECDWIIEYLESFKVK